MSPTFSIRAKSPYLESASKIISYNSLGGEKREFIPLDKSAKPAVKMYVCGLTPYDAAHMGHMVPALAFDLIRNYLEYRNLKVNFVQNVTDIDDKIIDRVRETGEDPRALTEGVTKKFYAHLKSMHVRAPDRIVKVSETLDIIIKYITELIEQGFAYATPEGNVYFDIAKKDDYGKLSNQRLSELMEGVRVESEKDKRSPLDFALWKRDESSKLSTSSPWGVGRPGWHIECSAMIDHSLGTPIDIHGGGLDLKFPHHENEIAQSEAHDKRDFVRYWMHVGLLTVDGTKMSKSLGNFLTIDDAFKKYGPELIRYVFLVHHYRSNVNLADKVFLENLNGLWDLYRTLELAPQSEGAGGEPAAAAELIASFEKAMDEDFNAPVAVVALRKALSALRSLLPGNPKESALLAQTMREAGKVLGLFQFKTEEVLEQGLKFVGRLVANEPPTLDALTALLERREKVRAEKNFAESDKIRDELKRYGLEYLDSKGISLSGRKLLLNLRFAAA